MINLFYTTANDYSTRVLKNGIFLAGFHCEMNV